MLCQKTETSEQLLSGGTTTLDNDHTSSIANNLESMPSMAKAPLELVYNVIWGPASIIRASSDVVGTRH